MSQQTLSGKQVSHNSRPYYPVDSRASRSPVPDSDEARRTTVISGRKCFEWCRNSGPLGSLERTLLASSVWHSMMCVLIWSVRVTPTGRSLYQLRASVPRTKGRGSSLWPTPTTPRPHDNDETAGKFYPSQNQKDLTYAVNMWPTPHANCSTGAGEHGDGGLNLQTAVSMFPTPTSSMQTLGDMEQARYAGSDPRRPDYQAANRLLPTPIANDAKNATLPPAAKKRDSIPGALIREGISGSLNPVWVEWLMGFPPGWTDCDASETQ